MYSCLLPYAEVSGIDRQLHPRLPLARAAVQEQLVVSGNICSPQGIRHHLVPKLNQFSALITAGDAVLRRPRKLAFIHIYNP